MNKNKSNPSGQVLHINRNRTKQSSNHRFTNVREMLCVDASVGSPAPIPLAASTTKEFTICPFGIGGITSGFVLGSWEAPHLVWFLNTARNFSQYRIVRASLVIVGNVPSTATGNFSVFSSPDAGDGSNTSFATTAPGVGIATLATRDYKVPLNIDSSWKKVTGTTMANVGSVWAPLNNVNSLSSGMIAISNNGTTALGIAYLDYDVEFKGQINLVLNA
jgi:hypothetical protein